MEQDFIHVLCSANPVTEDICDAFDGVRPCGDVTGAERAIINNELRIKRILFLINTIKNLIKLNGFSGSGGDWRILLFDITLGGAEEIL